MRVWDEELLTGGKIDVVRDGLVFWVDFQDSVNVSSSITQGATVGTITDRIANVTASIQSDRSSDNNRVWFERADGFLVLHPTNATAYNKAIILPSQVSGCKALEFVYRSAGSDNKGSEYYADRVIYSTSQNQIVGWNRAYSYSNSNLIGTAKTLHVYTYLDSNGKGRVYFNGTQYGNTVSTSYGTSFATGTKLALVGVKGTTETQPYKLGCIRLYNRSLTADELANNINYEISIGRLVL